MEKRIAFFSCQESSRIKVEEKLSHIGKQKENYYLPLFLMDEINWPVTSCIGLYLQQVLLVICLAGTVLARSNVWGIGLLVVATEIPTTLAEAPIGVALPPISVPIESVHASIGRFAPLDAASVLMIGTIVAANGILSTKALATAEIHRMMATIR